MLAPEPAPEPGRAPHIDPQHLHLAAQPAASRPRRLLQPVARRVEREQEVAGETTRYAYSIRNSGRSILFVFENIRGSRMLSSGPDLVQVWHGHNL